MSTCVQPRSRRTTAAAEASLGSVPVGSSDEIGPGGEAGRALWTSTCYSVSMNFPLLSLRADASAIHDTHRGEYLAHLTAPMDDMWASFADHASDYELRAGERPGGFCSVDSEGRLLRLHVLTQVQELASDFLRLVRRELGVSSAMVFSQDPACLGVALGQASKVDVHSLVFRRVRAAEVPVFEELSLAGTGDQARIVAFQHATIGAPLEFLEGYVAQRVECGEMFLHEVDGELACVGELRRDPQQPGIAHLGMIVHLERRGQGIATRMLASLAQRSQDEGLVPHCSTEVGNVGAQRAIERAGFRSDHRLLHVHFEPV